MTVYKNFDIEEIRNLFSITERFVMGHTEDSEYESDREYWSFMDKIVIVSSTSDQVDKDKDPRLLLLFLVSLKIVRTLTDRNEKDQLTDFQSIVYVQRSWLDKKRIWREMYSKFRTCQDLREEILVRTLKVSRPWRWKEMLWNMEVVITNLTKNVIPSLQQWYYDPREQNIQSLRMSATWIVEFWEEWKKRKHTFTTHVSNKEFLFRIIHSVNKLSIYGVVICVIKPSEYDQWFWRLYSRTSRIHITPNRSRIHSILSNSWRNNDWTSSEISHWKNSWCLKDWYWNFIFESFTTNLNHDMCRDESSCERNTNVESRI